MWGNLTRHRHNNNNNNSNNRMNQRVKQQHRLWPANFSMLLFLLLVLTIRIWGQHRCTAGYSITRLFYIHNWYTKMMHFCQKLLQNHRAFRSKTKWNQKLHKKFEQFIRLPCNCQCQRLHFMEIHYLLAQFPLKLSSFYISKPVLKGFLCPWDIILERESFHKLCDVIFRRKDR